MVPDRTVTVLHGQAHGMSIEAYAEALRERLPGYEVRHAQTPAEERELVVDASIVTGQDISESLLDRAEDLRLFACASAGINHLPLESLAERGITVTNASGIHGPNIAEHVLGSVLLFARRLDEGLRRNERGEWRHYRAFGELYGSTVTVVGLGSLGQATVERLSGFDVRTIGVRYTPSKGGPTDEVIGYERRAFHDALARTDYLVVTCPLTETTEGLVGETELRALPTDAVIVNVARGSVIDTDALVAAVRNNGIHAAALDVTDPEPLPDDHPLCGFENVLITPHMSGHTWAYWTRLADVLARNVERVEETGSYTGLENQVRPE